MENDFNYFSLEQLYLTQIGGRNWILESVN